MHGESCAIDSGGRNLEPQRQAAVYRVQRGKPSARRCPPVRHTATADGGNFARRISQQELGRICDSRSTNNGLRVHALRFGGQGNMPSVAGPANDGALGNSRPRKRGRGPSDAGARVSRCFCDARPPHRIVPEFAAGKSRQAGDQAGNRSDRPKMKASLGQRLTAEFLGTGFLVATVIGSGIMGERLAGGNVGLAPLGTTLPTGGILVVLILALGPISGAHFNPAVSLVMSLRRDHPWREFLPYA